MWAAKKWGNSRKDYKRITAPKTFLGVSTSVRRKKQQKVGETMRNKRAIVAEYVVAGQDYFYRLAYSHVRDREAAMDIVQESIAKALAKADSLREPAYIRTWFYRILANECMDHFRRNGKLVPFEEGFDRQLEEVFDLGDKLDLYDAILKLEQSERMVIQLRFFEDMKLSEIAEVTDTNLNTVKSRLYGGLKKLRLLTEEADYEQNHPRRKGAL